jgi:RepB DNA-primase from phage plasmid
MSDADREAWRREFDTLHARALTDVARADGRDRPDGARANGAPPPDAVTSPASITPVTSAAEFLARLFGPTSEMPVYLSSLPNAEDTAGEPGERHVFTRDHADIEAFMRKWDRAKRGLFFCVATMRPDNGRRAKENAAEIILLHADVDMKDIDLPRDEILRRLGQLRLLPTWVVATGHGFHLYWLLREAVTVTEEASERVENCLRLLCEHVGGDRACNEISRLMRLPFSHNSKLGEWQPVEVLSERPNARYELEEIEEWLAETAPIVRRKTEAPAADNPWLAVAARFGLKPPIDVEQRLAGMRYGGVGDSAIHPTQVSVTAALLNRGHSLPPAPPPAPTESAGTGRVRNGRCARCAPTGWPSIRMSPSASPSLPLRNLQRTRRPRRTRRKPGRPGPTTSSRSRRNGRAGRRPGPRPGPPEAHTPRRWRSSTA